MDLIKFIESKKRTHTYFTEEEVLKKNIYWLEEKDLKAIKDHLEKIEEAGKEATSLIAHLKDQHGFNEVEEEAQDKIMDVFQYEGRW